MHRKAGRAACGNGGSFSDALHFSGELLKEFRLKRCLPAEELAQYAASPYAESLRSSLKPGLPVVVLGLNGALNSAIANDMPAATIAFAQELRALAQPGDLLLGISTSGNAANIGMACAVAKARKLKVAALLGRDGGQLAKVADACVIAPGADTAAIQNNHVVLYHALASALEEHFYHC